MKATTLGDIKCNPSAYKICECETINYYKNEKCINCNKKLSEKIDKENVIKWVKERFRNWKEEGYKENEINYLKYDI